MSTKTTTKTTKTRKKTVAATGSQDIVSVQDLALDASKRKKMPVGFSVWIRSLLQNWRQGTVACKGRSDVAHSNKKPWKQKGTGRARAGSARSPLWRGGGVTFGPQPRTRTLSVSRKLKQGVLNSMLFQYLEDGKVRFLDLQVAQTPKTSVAFTALRNAELHDKKVTLFLPADDYVTYASFANLPNVRVLFFDQANAYDLANSDYWLLLRKDVDQFKEMASRWI
ncbi:MAG TPA: 50S ribosomal protein L4 [Candidatus Limnocylindria bacterium]|nr:50S ribosomal protein L4 [Candidatus Limnocylindria bacterium]